LVRILYFVVEQTTKPTLIKVLEITTIDSELPIKKLKLIEIVPFDNNNNNTNTNNNFIFRWLRLSFTYTYIQVNLI